jgi:amino acid transporter
VDRAISSADGYFDRVLKCVPVEVTAVYVLLLSAASTAFDGTTLRWWTFVLFLFGLLGTPSYAYLMLGIRLPEQLLMTTVAFLVVVAVGGGWFATFSWWSGFYPLLVTVAFGVAVALLAFNPPRPRTARSRASTRTKATATPPGATPDPTPSQPADQPAAPPSPRGAAEPPAGPTAEEEDTALLRVWRGVDPPGSVRP